ncbi:MAG TPA: GntR family transcriptional regulator [Actinocrinis sp.]|uniref:GntR family transcriptional regulator n=1 Tax=Actinocrinis sp. TaxID=1920516 RepID=UPI002DDCDE02|nr:GntR family transcriptional regulator [Actinocrinis sp.]HEV2347779.1 GntR family transcriptional regulator [Actinocrinis sp.]
MKIADELRQQIVDGRLAPGARFPTLGDIQGLYGVAEGTAHQATRVLVNEGLIDPNPGAQTRVRERPEVIRLVRSWYLEPPSGSPWHADLAAQGRVGAVSSRSTTMNAPPAIAERLAIATGDRVMRTSYTYTADSKPVFLATSWEPAELTAGTASQMPEGGPLGGWGVVRRLREVGIIVTRAVEEIVPRTLTGPEAEGLNQRPGIAIVVMLRIHYAGNRAVETSDLIITPPYRPQVEIPVLGAEDYDMGVQ